ncbi:MAG: leucine-rich repeat protein [Clostridia bacterium]|nr:leucine-rich repeat protein [Clostridia bacterium]
MKKKIFLFVAIIATLMCFMAISSSAATALKPQTTNDYGELSFFDESISVGRTNTKYGFTPYIDAEGTTYARVVVGDGTTFYTFPTAYVLSETTIYGSEGNNIFVYDLTSLNSAMEKATGTNPGWSAGSNIYRIEMPYTVNRVNGSGQNFGGFENVIEIYLQPNSAVQDSGKNCIFWKCKNLETIHNLDTFVFKNGSTGGSFQECAKLTNLTIGVSPEVTDTGENMFNGCTNLQSVNIFEAFPNLTTIGKSTFYDCKAIKYLSIPPTIETIGTTAFANCTSLVFVDFNDNQNEFNVDNWGQFMGCTSLLAVSLPDNYKYIPNRMFAGCSSLKAVYLPKNLVRIDTNGWNEDPFNSCKYLYFVQEAFEVVDENGKFYTADTFVQPSKPDVYYMPTTLSALCTNKGSGKCFTSSYNLNPTIVFGTNMTKTTTADGIFLECGSNGTLGSGITVVFLGDMEQICINTNGNRAKGIKYVFANENDKSLADVNIINNTTNGYNLNDKTEGFYFCNGNCYYLLNNVQYNGTYSDTVLTKVEGTNHIRNPKADTITTSATCTNNAIGATYCFCKAEISEGEIEDTALGHNFVDDFDCVSDNECSRCDEVEKALYTAHAFVRSIVYSDFSVNGVKNCDCTNEGCTKYDEKDAVAAPIFTANGYSVREDGKALLGGYTIDTEALKAYNLYNNTTLTYGIVMSNASNVTFDKYNSYTGGKGVMVTENNENYTTIKYTISGFSNVASLIDLKLVITLYVIDANGNMTFIQNETSVDTASASIEGKDSVSVNAVTLRCIAEKTLTDDETINDSEKAEYKAILEAIKNVPVTTVTTSDEQ